MYRPYLSPKQIRRGCCLSLFVGINALTVLSALSVAVADVLSIIYHQLPRACACCCCSYCSYSYTFEIDRSII